MKSRIAWRRRLQSRSVPMPPTELLSKYERGDLRLTIVNCAIAVFGLGAVFYQVRLLTHEAERQSLAMEAQIWQGINRHQLEISMLMVQHADLRPYFESSKQVSPADPNFNRVMALADAQLDFMESFEDRYVRSLPFMGSGEKYWVLWEKYFQGLFKGSPALCYRYMELKDVYTSGVGEFARKGCAQQGNSK